MLKKTLIAASVALSFAATAGGWMSIDAENVTSHNGNPNSVAQYVRGGTEVGGLKLGVQSRTARYDDGSALVNSLEMTAGKSFDFITPFVGVGRDNGVNGSQPFNYGFVGISVAQRVGPGVISGGASTRVGTTSDTPKVDLAFASYGIPLSKTMNININYNRSYKDIEQTGFGVGLGFSF